MVDNNASLVARWWGSPTAQGFALGAVLGPGGVLIAFLLSARNKRTERLFGSLRGSVATSIVILVVGAIVLLTVDVF
jgi:hypothetical protein